MTVFLVESDWKELANCKGREPEDFVDKFILAAKSVRAEMLKVCSACEVREQCLDFGLKTESIGLFGGVFVSGGTKHDPLTYLMKGSKQWK